MPLSQGQRGRDFHLLGLECAVENVACSLIGKLETLWGNNSAMSQEMVAGGMSEPAPAL